MVSSEKTEEIRLENEDVMADFAEKGVDLSQKREFTFGVELSSKEECRRFSRVFYERFGSEIPEGAGRIVADHGDVVEFVYHVEMLPSVDNITAIECKLMTVAEDFDDAEVYWYFKE